MWYFVGFLVIVIAVVLLRQLFKGRTEVVSTVPSVDDRLLIPLDVTTTQPDPAQDEGVVVSQHPVQPTGVKPEKDPAIVHKSRDFVFFNATKSQISLELPHLHPSTATDPYTLASDQGKRFKVNSNAKKGDQYDYKVGIVGAGFGAGPRMIIDDP
jgi:hypothetical protein